MTITVVRLPNSDHVRRARVRAQRLARSDRNGGATVADVLASVVGLQAQDASAAALGVRARSRGLTAEDVRDALWDDRTVVRTGCMRGTLHVVAVDDLSWLLSVFGPVFVHRGRRRLADLGFDDDAADAAVGTIRDALARGGPLTRSEIADVLLDAGFEFDPGGQATYHLIRRAGLLGYVCQVAPIDGEEAFGLLDEWVSVSDPPDRDAALGQLARRYLAGYGPVSLDDFASWSGLPMADVREAWAQAETGAEESEARDDSALIDPNDDDGGTWEDLDSRDPLRLLPAYDVYLLGYESRDHAVPEEHARQVHPGGGLIRPTVVDDGRAVATWSLDRSRSTPVLTVDPFDALSERAWKELEREADDVGRFLDIEAELRLES